MKQALEAPRRVAARGYALAAGGVAAAATLNVVEPYMSGVGGIGVLLQKTWSVPSFPRFPVPGFRHYRHA